MASFTDIREALAATLATIPDLHESAYMLANPTPPSAEILVTEGAEYDMTFHRGIDPLVFTIRVLVAFTSDIGSQKRLDKMRDPSGVYSIKAAVEADKTLGGLVSDLRVTEFGPDQVFDGPVMLLGCDWRVEVFAAGT